MSETTSPSTESRVEQLPGQLAFEELAPKPDGRLHEAWKKFGGFICKTALWAGLGAGLGAIVAPAVSPSEVEVGPHDALVEPTIDGTVTIDLGPGDTLERPSDQLLGARITIKGLHGNNEHDDNDNVIDDNAAAYANLLSDTEQIKSDSMQAVIDKAKLGGLLGAITAAGLFGLLYFSHGPRRRHELSGFYHNNRRKLTAGILAGGLAFSTVGMAAWINSESDVAQATSSLKGTPLEGWTIESPYVREGVSEILGYIERNEQTAADFRSALAKETKQHPILGTDDASFTMVVVGNTKCNMVLPPSIGELVDLSGARYFVAPGDMVFSGSSVENTCVSSMAYHTKEAERITAMGNHSSDETEQAASEEGFVTLDRKPVRVSDRLFLGDDSPRRSGLAQDTVQEREETETEMGWQLATIACKQQDGVFAMVTNEPHAVEPSSESGCTTLNLTAGYETSLVEKIGGDGQISWYFTAGDATGTRDGTINLGEPNDVAEVSILKFNKQINQLLAYQTIKFLPDRRVEIASPVYGLYGFDVPPTG